MKDYLDKLETLFKSILAFDYSTTKALLEEGINPNSIGDYYGLTALHYAASIGDVECGKLLVFYGANPMRANNEGNTALDVARLHKHLGFASWLVSLDVRVVISNTVITPSNE